MSLLTIVQNTCVTVGITSPAQVIGSTDNQILQLLQLANQEGDDLANRYNWQALQINTTFTTLAAESQGSIATLAPGLRSICNDTIWNRTLRRPVFGPLTQQDFALAKSMVLNGPWNRYIIQGNLLKFNPIPTAGQTCAFDYISTNWCTDSSGVTGRSAWAADTDIGVLDEKLMTLGLIWRWQQAKKLDYAENFNNYERRVTQAIGRDGVNTALDMNGAFDGIAPGIFVPAGNW